MDWNPLVNRIKAGDPLAGPILVSAMAGQLEGYCALIAPALSQADREDAVERALVKVVQRINVYNPKRSTLPTWARAFVRNEVRDTYRRNEARGDWSGDPSLVHAGEARGLVEDDVGESHEPAPSQREIALIALMMLLDPADADLLYARAVELLSFEQIADRLDGDVSALTLRKRYQRARDRVLQMAARDDDLRELTEE